MYAESLGSPLLTPSSTWFGGRWVSGRGLPFGAGPENVTSQRDVRGGYKQAELHGGLRGLLLVRGGSGQAARWTALLGPA
jgi:hypothetical protein